MLPDHFVKRGAANTSYLNQSENIHIAKVFYNGKSILGYPNSIHTEASEAKVILFYCIKYRIFWLDFMC